MGGMEGIDTGGGDGRVGSRMQTSTHSQSKTIPLRLAFFITTIKVSLTLSFLSLSFSLILKVIFETVQCFQILLVILSDSHNS